MDFYSLFKQLLPKGPYTDNDASAALRSLYVKALGLDRTAVNLDALLSEIFPDTADVLISDWERVYGIQVVEGTPLYLRVQRLLAKINARPGLSKRYIQEALYPFFGYYVDIVERGLFRADDPASLTDHDVLVEPDEEVYRFLVLVDGSKITTPGFDRAAVQAFLDEIKPAHTQGDITFQMFATDDPFSLTDRDELSI